MIHTPLKEAEAVSYSAKSHPVNSVYCSLEENTMLWETNNLIKSNIWVGTVSLFLYESIVQSRNV
jgi:hypothetical protein